jgi:alpha-glucosidase
MKKIWWKEAVVYQIYPRSFMDSNGDGIGDIQGIISKLDYLKELGIDCLWICPMYQSPNDDNGYDISNYQEIMSEFGTMADFDLLLQEVHRRGMKLILDLVLNHTSDEHPWFIESRSSRNSPKRDWYIWRDGKQQVLNPVKNKNGKHSTTELCLNTADPCNLASTENTRNTADPCNLASTENTRNTADPCNLASAENTRNTADPCNPASTENTRNTADPCNPASTGNTHNATDPCNTANTWNTRNSRNTNAYEPNNWASIFGGSAWEYDNQTEQFFLHLFSRKQPDLNWENKEVRKSLYKMIHWWLDKGIDGFRVDAISHIKKETTLKDMPNPKGLKYVPAFPKMMNVKGIHTFLKELKEETFDKYDIMTVGEANGVSVGDIDLWVDEKRGKFNMVFQFEHLALWDVEKKKELDIVKLKEVLSRWQKGLEARGWNALFIENHDKPRIVSTWGDDKKFWRESATAFGAMYFLMQGTPFIYQGQEIGMTNVKYDSIEDYNDVATKNLYTSKQEVGVPHGEIMEIIWASSRDNSRTPMQWSTDEGAGFTTGQPWLKINPNFAEINVAAQADEPLSVLNFYKKMIRLKKSKEVFTYGIYGLLLEDDPQIFAYTRTLANEIVVIITNLSPQHAKFGRVEGITLKQNNLLLNNYLVPKHSPTRTLRLKPYETRVYRL